MSNRFEGASGEELWDRVDRTARAQQELDRPLGDAWLSHVEVVSRGRLVDVLLLEDQREWSLGTGRVPIVV